MATNVIISNGVRPATTAITLLYTSPGSGGGTRIIAFTASNVVATTQSYKVWIVPVGGSPTDDNRVIPNSTLFTLEAESPPELQNHLIQNGGTIHVQVDLSSSITFRVTGIEF